MKVKIRKESYGEVIQLWTDDRKTCVNLGSATKLVKTILSVDQSSKLRQKLSSFVGENCGVDDQLRQIADKAGISEEISSGKNYYPRSKAENDSDENWTRNEGNE